MAKDGWKHSGVVFWFWLLYVFICFFFICVPLAFLLFFSFRFAYATGAPALPPPPLLLLTAEHECFAFNRQPQPTEHNKTHTQKYPPFPHAATQAQHGHNISQPPFPRLSDLSSQVVTSASFIVCFWFLVRYTHTPHRMHARTHARHALPLLRLVRQLPSSSPSSFLLHSTRPPLRPLFISLSTPAAPPLQVSHVLVWCLVRVHEPRHGQPVLQLLLFLLLCGVVWGEGGLEVGLCEWGGRQSKARQGKATRRDETIAPRHARQSPQDDPRTARCSCVSSW
jgi:hypothetical protein